MAPIELLEEVFKASETNIVDKSYRKGKSDWPSHHTTTELTHHLLAEETCSACSWWKIKKVVP